MGDPPAYIDTEEQIALLKKRGMRFADECAARRILEQVGYFRLSAYWHQYLPADKSRFEPGTAFDDILADYEGDRQLRTLLFEHISMVEVALRTQLTDTMARSNGALWLQDAHLFNDPAEHDRLLRRLSEEFGRHDEPFVVDFKRANGTNPPPAWMLMEVCTFGTLQHLYDALASQRAKWDIASRYSLSAEVFASWLHTLVYLRNVSAHNARLFNRTLRVWPKAPRRTAKLFLSEPRAGRRSVYYGLAILRYCLEGLGRGADCRGRVLHWSAGRAPRFLRAAGFPAQWRGEPFWDADSLPVAPRTR